MEKSGKQEPRTGRSGRKKKIRVKYDERIREVKRGGEGRQGEKKMKGVMEQR